MNIYQVRERRLHWVETYYQQVYAETEEQARVQVASGKYEPAEDDVLILDGHGESEYRIRLLADDEKPVILVNCPHCEEPVLTNVPPLEANNLRKYECFSCSGTFWLEDEQPRRKSLKGKHPKQESDGKA